jgi:hypothetical protein
MTTVQRKHGLTESALWTTFRASMVARPKLRTQSQRYALPEAAKPSDICEGANTMLGKVIVWSVALITGVSCCVIVGTIFLLF